MLMTLVVILVVLWLLGMVTSYTMGGLIHILLVIAIVVILVRVIQGRGRSNGGSSMNPIKALRSPDCRRRVRACRWRLQLHQRDS